jgi:hypothetical protein
MGSGSKYNVADCFAVGAVYDRALVAFDGKNRAVIDRAYSKKDALTLQSYSSPS